MPSWRGGGGGRDEGAARGGAREKWAGRRRVGGGGGGGVWFIILGWGHERRGKLAASGLGRIEERRRLGSGGAHEARPVTQRPHGPEGKVLLAPPL